MLHLIGRSVRGIRRRWHRPLTGFYAHQGASVPGLARRNDHRPVDNRSSRNERREKATKPSLAPVSSLGCDPVYHKEAERASDPISHSSIFTHYTPYGAAWQSSWSGGRGPPTLPSGARVATLWSQITSRSLAPGRTRNCGYARSPPEYGKEPIGPQPRTQTLCSSPSVRARLRSLFG